MSQKRTGRTAKGPSTVAEDQQTSNVFVGETAPNWCSGLSRNSTWIVFGLVAFCSIGVFGAGSKELEEDARDQNRIAQKDRSLLSNVPIPLPPTPLPPTLQLSKEYIYAGSRLLSVEDANANAAPPANLAIWRPSTGTWWVMGGQGSQQTVQGWGMAGDIPVPGDYDGDGKTDFSVFRPSTNTWYFVNSSTGATGGYAFGAAGDKVVQADYDGDGKTDTAIFRPSTGFWYILRSSDSGVTYQQFGLSTDTPAPADYDGDGKADIGVWRSSDQTFYSINSGNNAVQQPYLGQSGEGAVSADYDGDGKADYAIYNSLHRHLAHPPEHE